MDSSYVHLILSACSAVFMRLALGMMKTNFSELFYNSISLATATLFIAMSLLFVIWLFGLIGNIMMSRRIIKMVFTLWTVYILLWTILVVLEVCFNQKTFCVDDQSICPSSLWLQKKWNSKYIINTNNHLKEYLQNINYKQRQNLTSVFIWPNTITITFYLIIFLYSWFILLTFYGENSIP